MAADKQDTKQKRYDAAYMRMAREWALLSHCERKQVGALIVKDQMIIADGYNGTPSGFPNVCEAEDGTTHWYVLHAEANAITKLAKSNNSAAVRPRNAALRAAFPSDYRILGGPATAAKEAKTLANTP